MKNYISSKLKIFMNQNKYQFSLINKNLKAYYKKKKFLGRLIIPDFNKYKKIKPRIKASYLKSNINDENMSHVCTLSKLLKISEKSLLKSLNTFIGLPHRYEIFLKRKNCVFINDSKATTFEATRFALKNTKSIFWIVGGLPKKNDKIILKNLKKNIIRSYIIGENTNFFKKQIKKHLNFCVSKTLKSSVINILKDIKLFNKQKKFDTVESCCSIL